MPNWKPEIVKTGSLSNRVRKIEGKRRGKRHLVILFDLPVGMWIKGGPRARELMMEIARQEIPAIEFSLATSVSLMPNVLSTMDPPWETTSLAAPKVASWFATELSHEERLELIGDQLRAACIEPPGTMADVPLGGAELPGVH